MSDPRHETVLTVLREAGAQTNLDDTDTLATKILDALDREHGAPAATTEPEPADEHADVTAGAGEAGEATDTHTDVHTETHTEPLP